VNQPHDDECTVLATGPNAPEAPRTGDDNALPSGTRLGEFEITGLLGKGGFGIVYLAYDSSLDRHVALKEYMPSAFAARTQQARVRVNAEHDETFQAGLRSFVNEARLLAHFDDPSLIKVYRFWEANGTAYMVMPYYQGPTLKEALMMRPEPPDEAWLKRLLAPLLDTLALLHEQQCFHRDISPDNILMLEDGRPLLLDFGAARRAIGGMTQEFTVIYKQNYAPIEQYADTPAMQQGAWTDLFALAAVVHFAIAGCAPPPAVARVMTDPYVPLAERFAGRLSAGFLAAIDRALSVRPEHRPQSAAEMRALLRLADRRRVARPVVRPRWHYLAACACAATVIAAVVAAASGYATLRGKAPPAATPVAAAPFVPAAALQHVVAGASTERSVDVKAAQPRVQIGRDRLNFSVRASHDGYLYVQMVGSERSHFWLLFPNAVDKDNFIKAGQTVTLPRRGWHMGVDGPPGTDHFVAIVSDVPRSFDGAGLVAGELFSEFPIARARQMHSSYTGATPLFAGTPDCAGKPGCSPAYGASMFSVEEVAN
jgi:hypothetical protein